MFNSSAIKCTNKNQKKKNKERNYLPNTGLEHKIYYFTGFKFVTCFVKWNNVEMKHEIKINVYESMFG